MIVSLSLEKEKKISCIIADYLMGALQSAYLPSHLSKWVEYIFHWFVLAGLFSYVSLFNRRVATLVASEVAGSSSA